MRKILSTAVMVLFGAFAGTVFANNSSIMGVVNLEEVLLKSPQFSTAKAELKKKFEPQEKAIKAAQEKFQKDVDAYSKNSPTMKSDEQKKEQGKLAEQQKNLQDMQIKFQNDASTAQNNAMRDIMKRIDDAIAKVAEAKKMDVVFAKAGIAYSKLADVTNDVISQLKK